MSWHCSQVQGEGFSLPTYLDGIRSQRSRSRSAREKSCCNGNATGCSTSSQSGMMSAPSTASLGEDSLMLFPEDSPAKTSVQRVKVRDLPEPVRDCGSSICESLKRHGLVMSSRKTVRTCVPEDSAPSSKDLPAWGMTFDGACWELGMSARRTSETECGYWPTPTAVQRPNEGNMRLVRQRAQAGEISWEEAEAMVGKDVRLPHGKLKQYLATPTETANQLSPSMMKHPGCRAWLPTPQASDNRDRSNLSTPAMQRRIEKGKQINLGMSVSHESGRLNPPWVEWLMGWPIGWTDSKPLETDRFQQWLRQHSASCQAVQHEPTLPHHHRHAR